MEFPVFKSIISHVASSGCVIIGSVLLLLDTIDAQPDRLKMDNIATHAKIKGLHVLISVSSLQRSFVIAGFLFISHSPFGWLRGYRFHQVRACALVSGSS